MTRIYPPRGAGMFSMLRREDGGGRELRGRVEEKGRRSGRWVAEEGEGKERMEKMRSMVDVSVGGWGGFVG